MKKFFRQFFSSKYWFYFTFGSDEQYPYPNGYLKIQANNINQAIAVFRAYHPDRTPDSGVYNAAFSYSEEEWLTKCGRYYIGIEPSEIISRTIS